MTASSHSLLHGPLPPCRRHPAIRIGDVIVAEGDSGSRAAQFMVSPSVPSSLPVTVDYATLTTGSATPAADYLAVSGRLEFAAGTISKVVEIPVLGDSIDEMNETFTVALSSAVGCGQPAASTWTPTTPAKVPTTWIGEKYVAIRAC